MFKILDPHNRQSNYPNDNRSMMENKDYEDPTTFVKVRLTDKSGNREAGTDCREGLDPEWNESLIINYKAKSYENGKTFTLNE